MRHHLALAALAASACAGSALADLRGGVVLTNDQWNAEASAAIGQTVTVTRFFALFDEADDILVAGALRPNSGYDSIHAPEGGSFYQHPFGSNAVTNLTPASLTAFPAIRWDSFLTNGPLTADPRFPEFVLAGDLSFGEDSLTTDTSVAWYVQTVFEDDGTRLWPGAMDGPDVLFDESTGLYGVALAQLTLLGEHDEFESIGEAPVSDDLFASQLFTGGMEVFWIEEDGEIQREGRLTFAVPAPGAVGLFAVAGLAARRRR